MLGITLDEKALIEEGHIWFDTLLEQNAIGFVELSPEKRAAPDSLYKKVMKSLAQTHSRYQLHMPYFSAPEDYLFNSLRQSKQKIVNTLESWLSYAEKLRISDDCIPIILHPNKKTDMVTDDVDQTAEHIDLFLNLLEKLGLSRAYGLHIENQYKGYHPSFATSLTALLNFKKQYFKDQELKLCLDLGHYVASKDHSIIPYSDIELYHIHQYSYDLSHSHLSLIKGPLDFAPHYLAIKALATPRVNLELLQYAEPNYTKRIPEDLKILSKALEY